LEVVQVELSAVDLGHHVDDPACPVQLKVARLPPAELGFAG